MYEVIKNEDGQSFLKQITLRYVRIGNLTVAVASATREGKTKVGAFGGLENILRVYGIFLLL